MSREDLKKHSPRNKSDVEGAMEFAKKKHAFQLRKDEKISCRVRLEQVVNNAKDLGIKDNEILCAAWLHDTIEDTNTDYDDIAEKFSIEVAQIVA